jgi:hypothetical protein
MPITLGDVSIGSSSGTVETGGNIHIKNINGVIGVGNAALSYGSVPAFGRASTAGFHISGSTVGDLCIGAEFGKSVLIGTGASGTLERRMQIDGSGRVTMPNQPAFQVENIASRIAAGSVVPWSSVISNRGSHYNSSTHRFTAPVAGYYQFNLSAFSVRTTSTGDYYWDIRKNNTLKFRVYQAKSGNADTHAQAMGALTVELSANDYVDVLYSFGAVNMETGASHNNFSGYLIG